MLIVYGLKRYRKNRNSILKIIILMTQPELLRLIIEDLLYFVDPFLCEAFIYQRERRMRKYIYSII